MSRLTRLANSPQGRRMADKARAKANDPRTRRQVEEIHRKLAGRRR
ncbi:MAG TPA: hypothetical protein VGV40_12720 [Solirubrobacteraceae bacterium]|nr:hypothetical protein [Solirubrobacteraceae bacterium]